MEDTTMLSKARNRFAGISLIVISLIGCTANSAGPGAAIESRQALASIEKAAVEIATTLPSIKAAVEVASPRAGRDNVLAVLNLNVAGYDLTALIPTAATMAAWGFTGYRLRRARRHATSLGKAIKATHNQFDHGNEVLKALRKNIEDITRNDETEAENERMVRRFQPRK